MIEGRHDHGASAPSCAAWSHGHGATHPAARAADDGHLPCNFRDDDLAGTLLRVACQMELAGRAEDDDAMHAVEHPPEQAAVAHRRSSRPCRAASAIDSTEPFVWPWAPFSMGDVALKAGYGHRRQYSKARRAENGEGPRRGARFDA